MADEKKNKRIKSILGYLQENVPGAPVDATTMDEEEDAPADMEEPADGVDPAARPPLPTDDGLDDLMKKKKKRQGKGLDAFSEGADEPTWVNGGY